MKFPKGLLVAVALLAVLSGGVYWSNKKKAEDDKKPPADAAPKILTIAEDQFKEIRLGKKDAAPVVLSRATGTWQITQPEPMAADQDAVAALVNALSSLASDRLIDEKAGDLTGYGLTAPSEQVVITKKDGKTDTLLIGDDTPTQAGTFVKLANDPRVFTIATYVKTNLDKSPKDLRDKRLLTFNSDKLTRLTLNAIEFGKSGPSEWQILKPKPMRADGAAVDELVRKVKDAKLDPAVSDEDAKKALAGFNGGTKVATVTATDSGGMQSLEVRKDKDKNYFAKSSAVAGAHKVTAEIGDALAKSLDDFRNKKLFDFGFTDPGKVEIGSSSFVKSGDKWMANGTQMDPAGVQGVIDKLRDLSSSKFVDAGGGEAFLTIATTSDKKVEKLNVTKKGDNFFAVREGEPSVYQVDAKAIDELQKAAASVKPYTAPKPDSSKAGTKKK